jgi:hypothetical protein
LRQNGTERAPVSANRGAGCRKMREPVGKVEGVPAGSLEHVRGGKGMQIGGGLSRAWASRTPGDRYWRHFIGRPAVGWVAVRVASRGLGGVGPNEAAERGTSAAAAGAVE